MQARAAELARVCGEAALTEGLRWSSAVRSGVERFRR
jgi:hypothetical protein